MSEAYSHHIWLKEGIWYENLSYGTGKQEGFYTHTHTEAKTEKERERDRQTDRQIERQRAQDELNTKGSYLKK